MYLCSRTAALILSEKLGVFLSDPRELGGQLADLGFPVVHFKLESLIPMTILLPKLINLLLIPLLEVLLGSQIGLEDFALVAQFFYLEFGLLQLQMCRLLVHHDVALRQFLSLYHFLDLGSNTLRKI